MSAHCVHARGKQTPESQGCYGKRSLKVHIPAEGYRGEQTPSVPRVSNSIICNTAIPQPRTQTAEHRREGSESSQTANAEWSRGAAVRPPAGSRRQQWRPEHSRRMRKDAERSGKTIMGALRARNCQGKMTVSDKSRGLLPTDCPKEMTDSCTSGRKKIISKKYLRCNNSLRTQGKEGFLKLDPKSTVYKGKDQHI